MIKKTLFSFLIALVAFGFTACESDDNNGPLGVPDSAKPSKEFKVGNRDKEKNADDAIKLNVKSWGNTNQEFASDELFAAGHFLITSPKAGKLPKSVFYAWSEEARKKKEDCDNGTITPEDFSRWLKES